MITIKYIKFCKTYNLNLNYNELIDKYEFILNKNSNYHIAKNENTISFKKKKLYFFTNYSQNIISVLKVLRNGSVLINVKEKKICWLIPTLDLLFRSFIVGLIFSLSYFFYYLDNIVNTAILFFSLFLLTTIKNLIVLKLNIWYINNSVL